MNEIKDKKIKIVFWDLDDTLWNGTLGEVGQQGIVPITDRFEMIELLNKRGIISSICSKNDYNTARDILKKLGYWDMFIMPQISYTPKGEMIKNTLKELGLRPQNCLFIDDNDFNLREVEFYNDGCSVVNCNHKLFKNLIEHPSLKGKDDRELTRFYQYKQLEDKVKVKKTYSSNEKFLAESNIVIEFIDYTDSLLDRLYELSDRTNQLNFTKNRMSKEELKRLANDKDVELKLISVRDNFGDYGIVGFYALKSNTLIHFVFSCRIMNMNVENCVYAFLNHPQINVIGDVASSIGRTDIIPEYITLRTYKPDTDKGEGIESIDLLINDDTKLNIYGLGACDLYHPIAFFAMPNHTFQYECNVFNGKERGVNVGTEYIRSIFEMSDNEKQYCIDHFNNYRGSLSFNSSIFKKKWDYMIISFHDDQVFKIYKNRDNPNIRVLLSPSKAYGDTSITNIGTDNPTYEQQRDWLQKNFLDGQYITPERFYENLKWIEERVPETTKLILITGPELDFFRKNRLHDKDVRQQILKLNNILWRLEKENPNKFAVVDINKIIRTTNDVTDYVYHLKADTAYKLFVEITWTIINRFGGKKTPMLSSVINNRKLVIFGNNTAARNSFYNLKLGNENPSLYVHFDFRDKKIGTMAVHDCNEISNKSKEYYVVISDTDEYTKVKEWLIENGYEAIKDFIYLKPQKYTKVWNENIDK